MVEATHRESPDRFAAIRDSTLYRTPSKRKRIPLDARFSHILNDRRFTSQARVDRYGRKLPAKDGQQALGRLYRVEEPLKEPASLLTNRTIEQSTTDAGHDLNGSISARERTSDDYKSDKARDGTFSDSYSSSSEESSSEDESTGADVGDIYDTRPAKLPAGEVSRRLAVVNLDWDHIRAADLLAVFSSFAPGGDRIIKATVYPSAFGKERMERESIEGPPREIFSNRLSKSSGKAPLDVSENSVLSEDERIKHELLQEDAGEDFDSTQLRIYQLERLRYYYAVLECSSSRCAKTIYDAIDGTEYQSTANFFDFRFVPSDMDFSEDTPRDECTMLPESYRPSEFVTDALQHSKVKLSWDGDDPRRAATQKRAFSGNPQSIEEDDLRTFLADSSSDDDSKKEEPRTLHDEHRGEQGGRGEHRSKIRALLGLSNEKAKVGRVDASVFGEMEVTFSSGLSAPDVANETGQVAKEDETTLEKYVRKEKERKSRWKHTKAKDDLSEPQQVDTKQDYGFDDPFFKSVDTDQPSKDARGSTRRRTEERRDPGTSKATIQQAELDLLLANVSGATDEVRHFDRKDLKQQAKASRSGKRKSKSKSDSFSVQLEGKDGFSVDVEDPRFTAIYEKSEFAVDPSHPRFEGTDGMVALLEETRRKRHKVDVE